MCAAYILNMDIVVKHGMKLVVYDATKNRIYFQMS